MAIYLGENKLTGTGVQVDDAINSSSTNPVQNKVVAKALSDVGYSDWQKPADWPNIQSGALPNSVYLLVGHSADYSAYPTFGINAVVSNSGTYDVYVDGIKQATTSSNTATTLNWQTLALETGFDVTYPTAFRTHIVRITPTTSTNTFTAVKSTAGSSNKFCVLWAHFELDNVVNIRSGFAYYPYLEAVTAKDDTIQFDDTVNNNQHGLGYCFNGAGASAPNGILHLPILKGSNSTEGAYMYYAFNGANVSNCVIRYKDCSVNGTSDSSAWEAKGVQTDNARVGLGSIMKGPNITKLPPLSTIDSAMPGPTTNLPNLEPVVLDLSGIDYYTRLRIYGTSSARMDGLKGLTVSSSAPFDNTSSPQINVSYTGLSRAALVNLFNSLPTVSASQVCNITGATGASDLTASDIAIVTGKGWTLTR